MLLICFKCALSGMLYPWLDSFDDENKLGKHHLVDHSRMR